MPSPPLVSVVTIFLNAERFLREAIDSVLAQTYEPWELLLVDDGSTDGSTEIARAYEGRFEGRIRCLEHPAHENRGMSTSRNLGIRWSRGALVALLDADDVWFPNKLEDQVTLLEANPEAGMVCGASQYWRSWAEESGDGTGDVIVPIGAPQPSLVRPPALFSLLYPLGKGAAPCPSSLILRRATVEQVGGFEESFRGHLQLYEDQAFLAKIYLQAAVFVAPSCWDRYRQRPDSCVATVTRDGHYHTVRESYLRWLQRYVSEKHLESTETGAALRRALWPYRHPLLNRIWRRCRSAVRVAMAKPRRISLPGPVNGPR
jgi:glycosyltransferase involved in cell wall biosynthesis